MFFIPSGPSDNQSLNSRTGSLFPPSVLNVACGFSSPDGETSAPYFSGTFPELNNFSSIFWLSYNYVFHVCVAVFWGTTKSQLFSQVFEVDIGQDLFIKNTQRTFFTQGWFFFLNTIKNQEITCSNSFLLQSYPIIPLLWIFSLPTSYPRKEKKNQFDTKQAFMYTAGDWISSCRNSPQRLAILLR